MTVAQSSSIVARAVARIRAPLVVKLEVAFLLVIAMVLATGLVSFCAMVQIDRQVAAFVRLNGAAILTRGLDHSIVAQEHLSSMFLLTGEESYHAKLTSEGHRFRAMVRRLTSDDADHAELGRIDEAFARYALTADGAANLRREGRLPEAQALHVAREHVIAHEIEDLTRALVARVDGQQQVALGLIEAERRQASWIVGGFFVLSIVLALALGRLLAASIVQPIQQVDGALQRIAQGEFVTVTGFANGDELGSTVGHVNQMSRQLADLYGRERRASQDLREQFESLRHAQAQLVQTERLRALGEMAGGVAHDFNNLLTVVLGQAEYLHREVAAGTAPAREITRRLESIGRAAEDGAATVRRLLDFARPRPAARRDEAIVVGELFSTVLAMTQPRWKDEALARGQAIEAVTEVRSTKAVVGNLAELREVLLNLVFNAVDAMPRGGRLTLSCRDDADNVYLDVADTGGGMTDDVASRVFEPFFTTKGPQSSGLGLSVSYGIIRRHGGDISIDTAAGGGSRITIRLPARAVTPTASPGVLSAPAPIKLRVLVIDDESEVRHLLRDLLTADGHQVWEAASGVDGIEILEQHAVDLVCTDLGMPGMTGWQVATAVKASWPGTPVAMITGWGSTMTAEELAAAGIDFVIAKPFNRSSVAGVLSRIAPPV